MRILAACHCAVANGFCFPGDDPGFELLAELTVCSLGSVAGIASPSHIDSLADRLAASGCFVAAEFVPHVNAQMMHDHRDAAGATAMGPEDGEERCVAVVGILGIVEEPSLGPLATADVGLGRKLADEPAIGCVNRNRFFLDVLP